MCLKGSVQNLDFPFWTLFWSPPIWTGIWISFLDPQFFFQKIYMYTCKPLI